MYNKITVGFVVQTFDDEGKPISQEFIAGDDVSYENMKGEVIVPYPTPKKYLLFNMVQPE